MPLSTFPAPAAADPPAISAEAAISRQRDQLLDGSGIGCRRGGDEEIVVCGSRNDDREPLAAQRVPGERVHLLPSEPPSALAAMSAGERSCAESRACGATIDFLKAGKVLVKIGKHILGDDD
ncbi:hypothetical protein E2493_14745 [Sphingomonas parva]|uniref:Uncharacterized protein n=1 Tax=Sphingomonas parva TaxID=2555898 RepID=A0A4Y8ZQP9_9SPHN|nr:hypothetical protein [Sphingomonas parva]TFI57465.1 hypothetical protein E2493_14745 [Sphingomonas parva]